MLQAVIGIGSNSVRLLVAEVQDGLARPVLRLREGTRLFASLVEGRLTAEGMRATADCVARQRQAALEAGARMVLLFATSATRDASNQEAFRNLLEAETGLSLEVLSGEEEALLAYRGVAQPGLSGVIDIGGGSTEWTLGRDGVVLSSQSAQVGAVRLAQALPIKKAQDIMPVVDTATAALQPLCKDLEGSQDAVWIGVGGTCTTLAAMDLGLTAFDEARLEDHLLTKTAVRDWLQRLAPLSLAERQRIPGLPAQRADIIPHGCAILLASMQLLDMRSLRVSNRGNLEGFLLART